MLEREAMAVLVSTAGISYGRREMALRAAGSAEAILADPGAYAAQLTQEGTAALQKMIRGGGIAKTLDALKEKQVHLVARGEAGYPQRLLEIAHPPHLLFVWGKPDLDDPFPVAAVGTRKASPYGISHTRTIARGLADAGVCVISGLATGIDAAAHRGALDARGRTIAVLGGALDRFFPESNRSLMHEILGMGGSVISEYPLGCAPTKYSFLHRNRIIAGMALGVLITEGARRSGALNTARHALEGGREVFALPGDVDSVGSQLPHMLIAEGAHLVTCAGDILSMLTIEPPAVRKKARTSQRDDDAEREGAQTGRREIEALMPVSPQPKERAMPRGLAQDEAAVWQALFAGECDFDELAEKTGIAAEELGALLMMMEMDGHILALPGLRYRLA